jgi:hypothetical protein
VHSNALISESVGRNLDKICSHMNCNSWVQIRECLFFYSRGLTEAAFFSSLSVPVTSAEVKKPVLKIKKSWLLVRKRTTPTSRPPLVGEF